jgi:hypothetical protein
MNSKDAAAQPMPPRAAWIARWTLAPICAMCALALTSCGLGTQATRATIPPEVLALLHPIPATPLPPAECPPLPLATDDSIPTLTRNHGRVSALYHQCAGRGDGLLLLLRKRERIEAERIARAAAALRASGE